MQCKKVITDIWQKRMPLIRKITRLIFHPPSGGFSFAPANGKLCFECLKTFSVPENHLPLTGKNASEVGIFRYGFDSTGLQQLYTT
jgi:hypothetical protein